MSLLIGLVCDRKPPLFDLVIKLLAQMTQLKPKGFTAAREIPKTGFVSQEYFRRLQRRLTFDYSRITNHNSLFPSAGVVQWQNGSFPSCTRGFDSPHPLSVVNRLEMHRTGNVTGNTSKDVHVYEVRLRKDHRGAGPLGKPQRL